MKHIELEEYTPPDCQHGMPGLVMVEQGKYKICSNGGCCETGWFSEPEEQMRFNWENNRVTVRLDRVHSLGKRIAAHADGQSQMASVHNVTIPSVAKKNDSEKTRLDLLPFEALEEVGKVMTFGAKKYDAHNWRKGFLWSRIIGAALRHIFSFARGEDKDPETGYSHLGHACCCLLFLLSFQLTGNGEDDRVKV